MHVETIGRRAGLAHVAHLGHHGPIDRRLDVGVFENDHRRVAAELHRRRNDTVGGRTQQLAPDLGRTCEADHPHAGITEQAIDQRAGFLRRQHVDEALRHARLFKQRHQFQHGERCRGGRLDDDGTAGGESGRNLACAHCGREVPRRHQRSDAGGLVLDQDPGAGGGSADDEPIGAHGFFREPAKELGRVDRLAYRVRARFAVFERDQTGDVLQPRGHQVEDLAQRFRSLPGRAARPIRKRGLRGVERGFGVGDLR